MVWCYLLLLFFFFFFNVYPFFMFIFFPWNPCCSGCIYIYNKKTFIGFNSSTQILLKKFLQTQYHLQQHHLNFFSQISSYKLSIKSPTTSLSLLLFLLHNQIQLLELTNYPLKRMDPSTSTPFTRHRHFYPESNPNSSTHHNHHSTSDGIILPRL